MASIDNFPCDFAIDRRPGSVALSRIPLTIPSRATQRAKVRHFKASDLPQLTAKQRYLLEWLFVQRMQGLPTTLSKLPYKAGLISVAGLSARGLVKVTIEFTEHGAGVYELLSELEKRADKRVEIENRKRRLNKQKALTSPAE